MYIQLFTFCDLLLLLVCYVYSFSTAALLPGFLMSFPTLREPYLNQKYKWYALWWTRLINRRLALGVVVLPRSPGCLGTLQTVSLITHYEIKSAW